MSIPLKIKDIRLWITLEKYLECVPPVDKEWIKTTPQSREKLSVADFPKKEMQIIKRDKQSEFNELNNIRAMMLSATPLWFWSTFWESLHEKAFKRLKRALYMLSQPKKDYNEIISGWEIEKARAYPISKLLPVNKQNFALCPFHNDNHPSLYCKNNWMHCFSCGWHGDTIQFIMEREKISFKEAVLKLQ